MDRRQGLGEGFTGTSSMFVKDAAKVEATGEHDWE